MVLCDWLEFWIIILIFDLVWLIFCILVLLNVLLICVVNVVVLNLRLCVFGLICIFNLGWLVVNVC